LAAYNRANQIKKLHLFPGDHFSAYTNQFDNVSSEAAQWFSDHL
jgi:hypothetical protein